MQSKLTQNQIDARLRCYDQALTHVLTIVSGHRAGDHEQATAVYNELVSARARFLKRMEAGAVGRKTL